MSERRDVVVVGAGPVGLALALGLARAGRSVLVLEKEEDTARHSRAPAIWPPTQEILEDLGVLGRLVDDGVTLPEIVLHDADADGSPPIVRLPVRELAGETRHPRLLLAPQSRTEAALRDALAEQPGARLRFSAEATAVEQDASSVRVACRRRGSTRTVSARFAVGCDGAHSTVRDAVGASFDGTTYRTRAALADVVLRPERDLPFPRLGTRGGLAVAIRIDAGLWRLILPFAADGDEVPLGARVDRAVRRLLPGGAHETVWQSEFRLHRRVASRFVAGRVALAGDAAHLNSPVGGQGMNAGIQDAAELTRALLEALDSGRADPLAAWGRRRRTTVEEGVNRFTGRMTRLLLFRRGALVKPTLRIADAAFRLGPLRRRFLRRIAMLERA